MAINQNRGIEDMRRRAKEQPVGGDDTCLRMNDRSNVVERIGYEKGV